MCVYSLLQPTKRGTHRLRRRVGPSLSRGRTCCGAQLGEAISSRKGELRAYTSRARRWHYIPITATTSSSELHTRIVPGFLRMERRPLDIDVRREARLPSSTSGTTNVGIDPEGLHCLPNPFDNASRLLLKLSVDRPGLLSRDSVIRMHAAGLLNFVWEDEHALGAM
eukprot:scaffold31693_cov112-Isochrysis_galbana.AAC.2